MDAKVAIRDIMKVRKVTTNKMAEITHSSKQRVCDRLRPARGMHLRVDTLVEFANALGYKVVLMQDTNPLECGWYEITNAKDEEEIVKGTPGRNE